MADFNIPSLRGGLNDSDPPTALENDACTAAENVEFYESMLGERRRGCVPITLPASITGEPTYDAVVWMHRHTPTNDEGASQLWVFCQDLATSSLHLLTYRNTTTWNTVTPVDAIDAEPTLARGHRLSAQSLHGKMHLGYKSAQNRLHVWDGTSLRQSGLAEPAAPTVAEQGAGTYSGIRYFRVRYTVQSAGTTLRRSEPSDTTTYDPAGGGSNGESARVTKPASIGESETHWEIEASLDNATFYRIATVVVGTTTYDDTTAFATGYAAAGVLSEDTGDYSLIPSGKFLSADNDRLIIGGSWHVPAEESRIRWTPVFGGPGVGNDERLEEDTDPFLDLDGFEGGPLTALSRNVNGYLFAFKWSHIYRLVRTGQRAKAYEAIPITKAHGALPGSLVEAVDQAGQACLYFLDPLTGPWRLGAAGLQRCSYDIQTVWSRVNKDAYVPCHGVYYAAKGQVHYWLAVDDAAFPNFKIVLQTNEMRTSPDGARRGWSTVAKNNRIATAHCSTMFSDNVDSTDPRERTLVPFIGKPEWVVGAITITDYVQRCDTGSTDAHTTGDTDSDYFGVLRTKAFTVGGLLNQHELKAAAVLVKEAEDAADILYFNAIRNFGTDEVDADTDMNPVGSEEYTIKLLDDLSMAEVYALQIEMGDLSATPATHWEINGLQLKLSEGQSA